MRCLNWVATVASFLLCGALPTVIYARVASSALATPPAQYGSTLRSTHARIPVDYTFVNITRRPIRILWVNYRGEEIIYTELWPARTWRVHTFATHPWVIRDARTAVAIMTVIAGETSRTIIIR